MTNLQKLQNKLTESGLDAMLLTDPKHRFYVPGIHSSAGAVVMYESK